MDDLTHQEDQMDDEDEDWGNYGVENEYVMDI